ncbi:unnamed protein product [Linum tenue]|uniref:Pectinesterase inhibitor domain-containing protein n=2 Tax=Linum tenue TaxID=586396 RepID=A0AAV0JW21_9ROSI|nr:unnamed protein product [Linum tenue]
MAKSLILLPSLIIALSLSTTTSAAAAAASSSSAFIDSSCAATRYPDLCRQSLSSYARTLQQNDHRRLALAALSVSLAKAKSVSSYVTQSAELASKNANTNPSVVQAVKDCTRNMGNGVNRLDQSVKELTVLGGLEGDKFEWHMSNLQTWVSAALTDENMCVEGFADRAMDGPVKVGVRRRVVYVAKITSNALALVQRFAAKHARVGRHHP